MARKKSHKAAPIGCIFSCLAFAWIIPGAERFTGYNILYGIAFFLFLLF